MACSYSWRQGANCGTPDALLPLRCERVEAGRHSHALTHCFPHFCRLQHLQAAHTGGGEARRQFHVQMKAINQGQPSPRDMRPALVEGDGCAPAVA